METKLDYVLSGPVQDPNQAAETTINIALTHFLRVDVRSEELEKRHLHNQLRKFWELEALGIHPKEDSVHDQFVERAQLKDSRYEVRLP